MLTNRRPSFSTLHRHVLGCARLILGRMPDVKSNNVLLVEIATADAPKRVAPEYVDAGALRYLDFSQVSTVGGGIGI
jgi:hypothetical protein